MAKLLTFFFTIVMAMVAIGIFKDVVEDFTSSPTQKLIGPGNCNDFSHSDMDYEQCMRSHAFALNSNNSVGKHFTLPVTPTLLYISALAVAFFLAGVFHFNEFTCLFHSIWFLLALPSGSNQEGIRVAIDHAYLVHNYLQTEIYMEVCMGINNV